VLSEYQPEQLLRGRIDIGISRFMGPIVKHDGLKYTVVVDEPLVAVVPSEHALAKQKSVSAVELATLPLILYPKDPRSPFGQQMIAALEAGGARPTVGHEAIEIHTALALVGAGLGATLAGKSIAKNNRRDVKFVQVRDIGLTTALVMITRDVDENKLIATFRQALVESGRR
jgi:DNA-binding transcriptional LysR family regulator